MVLDDSLEELLAKALLAVAGELAADSRPGLLTAVTVVGMHNIS